MNRIDKKFRELKRQKKKAFIAFLTAGDFGLKTTKRLVLEFDKRGVDIIELGVPFSDPIADGPTIQASSERALRRGTRLQDIIKMVGELRKLTDIPIVLMGYYNPVLKYGIKKFVSDCVRHGVDGVIVPDLPPDEADELTAAAKKTGFATIFLLSPTSTAGRIRLVSKKSKGFIYYVSLTGITGARAMLPKELISRVRLIKRYSDKPVCVGFGVSRPEQVREIARAADGIIVGSAIVKEMEKGAKRKDFIKRVGDYVQKLTSALTADREASHQ
ncbi:MAG: tryptophan synthase subunit alpha [Omnitrophica WOR_2 bacterium RIFCSPLOWO2_12_FULL_51_24]|nr:MAG: tryptophan synthase subunit alpha [Omnitrophica WOR_2 bacterium RIFCSPHIGHO2_01_FULL_49_10]OGX41889.1 MAG: tryptophan synthase subunit alpha [Omnitrophica WOR_2 bacterium RIFCSPLOWO2_12_FULL_51_24]